ncbi:MAG: rRNA adenine N-6-methyltransferase family protein [Candidatus Caldarchaeum sp.]
MTVDQHFLLDENCVRKLVENASVNKTETILDIGAGEGIISAALAHRAKLVYAVEKDHQLLPVLMRNLSNYPNVVVIRGDILKLRLPNYDKVVANPPFSVLEPFLMRHLRNPVLMSLLTPRKFADSVTSHNTSLGFKTALAYTASMAEYFPGEICQPPYPGDLCILVLTPKQKTVVEDAMIRSLSYSASKVRNALRNVLWSSLTKREAIRIVELSELDDHLLEKPVKRTTLKDLQKMFQFLKSVYERDIGDKHLRIDQRHP